jgi:hypothetical protein
MGRFLTGQTATGWGVVRPFPWQFAGIYSSMAEAVAKAEELGPDYIVRYGDNRVGSDDFIYDDVA